MASPPSTLLDKIWNNHLVHSDPGAPDLLYVDLHLLHEVTSAQAFEGLKVAGRTVRRPDLCVATVDHNIPTTDRSLPVLDSIARVQMEVLRENAQSHGIRLFDVDDERQGIVHVIGPELGLTRPGMVIVCGDSHTSTHGAFGALSFGIGTSEVEHVLATQCIPQRRPKAMEIRLEGDRPVGISAKDLILAIIGEVGVAGAAGHVIEYTGPVVGSLSMEERMTICNMSIEAGARAGMISPDTTTFEYLRDREFGPKSNDFDDLKTEWETLETDDGATFDRSVVMDIGDLEPQVTWGTNPGMVTGISGGIPNPDEIEDEEVRDSAERALKYMGLEPGTPMESINIDRVFVGSCTNGRLEDLREVARIVNGKRVHSSVHAMVVPGSTA
ncbi:MAG TPA: 3-isopropylmalate dehydratase large subunit, partial [Gemmatimonadetes bacterium]|nr:3-isopropylmalate dehydratase large subunit [Gemmatimonadota bacterium]